MSWCSLQERLAVSSWSRTSLCVYVFREVTICESGASCLHCNSPATRYYFRRNVVLFLQERLAISSSDLAPTCASTRSVPEKLRLANRVPRTRTAIHLLLPEDGFSRRLANRAPCGCTAIHLLPIPRACDPIANFVVTHFFDIRLEGPCSGRDE